MFQYSYSVVHGMKLVFICCISIITHMRVLFLFFVMIVALTMPLAGMCAPSEHDKKLEKIWNPQNKFHKGKPVRVLFFGDGYFNGYGLPNPEVASLPKQVEHAFQDGSTNVNKRLYLTMARDGETTTTALKRVREAIALKPDIMVICLGLNDALRKVDNDVIMNNLTIILNDVKRAGIYLLFIGTRAPQSAGYGYISSYNAVMARMAESNPQMLFMPYILQDIIHDPLLLQANELHPNQAGTRIIASTVLGHINHMIKKIISLRRKHYENMLIRNQMIKSNASRARRGLLPRYSKEQIDALK